MVQGSIFSNPFSNINLSGSELQKRFSNVCFKDLGGGEGLGLILHLCLAGERRAEKCEYPGWAIYSHLVAARINSALSPGLLCRWLMNSSISAQTCRLDLWPRDPPSKWCLPRARGSVALSLPGAVGSGSVLQGLVSPTQVALLEGKAFKGRQGMFVSWPSVFQIPAPFAPVCSTLLPLALFP